jgi:hypothetical protein
MKITVNDIRAIKPNKPLISALSSRLECNTTRNLVSYVNLSYPIEGYKYKCHVTSENVVQISLVPIESVDNTRE